MHDTPPSPPDFTQWPSFPFEGELRVKQLDDPVPDEPPRRGEGHRECTACSAPDEAYIWVGERWRVRAMDRPTGLPMVLILECRSHLDLGDLPNLLAAELGVMTVRLERAIRSLDGVARVHVNRWGDGSAHLHLWFLARPRGQLQLRGTFLPLWDSILPPIPESTWRENLALVAAWLAEFGGRPLAEPPRIQWQAPASFSESVTAPAEEEGGASVIDAVEEIPADEGSVDDGGPAGDEGSGSDGRPAADDATAANTDGPTREAAAAPARTVPPARGSAAGAAPSGDASTPASRVAAAAPGDSMVTAALGDSATAAATDGSAAAARTVATPAAQRTAAGSAASATGSRSATDGVAASEAGAEPAGEPR